MTEKFISIGMARYLLQYPVKSLKFEHLEMLEEEGYDLSKCYQEQDALINFYRKDFIKLKVSEMLEGDLVADELWGTYAVEFTNFIIKNKRKELCKA